MALSISSNSSRAPRSLPVLTSCERKSIASAAIADRVLIRSGILLNSSSASHKRPSTVYISAGLKARFAATRSETVSIPQLQRPLASMVNKMSCVSDLSDSSQQLLTADAAIEVVIDVPFTFRAIIPVQVIESTGTRVLQQLLDTVLPRFLAQLAKDYQAWASGDDSRQPFGRGEI